MRDHDLQAAHAASRVPHVGTYQRLLPVSIERLYENALDYAHLPHLHSASFADLECLESGPEGWRAQVTGRDGAVNEIELRLDRCCRRWITRTLAGANPGSEIWTHAFPISERRTDIVVDFFMPGIESTARERVGMLFAQLYERLYDEDVAMMVARQAQLDARMFGERGPTRVCLGQRAALQLPLCVDFRGRSMVVADAGDATATLVVFPSRCPHQLGPLSLQPESGEVSCPWHGYRFSVTTGACATGAACRLNLSADVVVDDDDRVWLIAREVS